MPLLIAVAYALAGEASAARPATDETGMERPPAARIAELMRRIDATDPALKRELPAASQLAQWRNR